MKITELLDQIEYRSQRALGDEPHPHLDGPLHAQWIDHQRQCAEDSQQDAQKLLAALRAVMDVHQKTEHQRAYGFPRADKWEHYCTEDNQSWPCPTMKVITNALGANDDHQDN